MRTSNIVPDFTALRVAIVGDLIVDHYLHGQPCRLSREAPVMVLRWSAERIGAGGAANVARNTEAMGARTSVVGAVGRDGNGRELLHLLRKDQLDVTGLFSVPGWTTPTKTRVLAAELRRTSQQILRIDREPEGTFEPEVRAEICERVRALAGRVDALLVSDYGYGTVDAELADAAEAVRAAGATVVLDPRGLFDPFRGATALTPNLSELAQAVGRPIESLASPAALEAAARELLSRVQPDWLLVTLGNRGMALFDRTGEGVGVDASGSDQVIDVSGAGDTAAAAFTLALAAGMDGPSAMRLANAASGVVVMESGTAVCSLSRLRSALPESPQPSPLGQVLTG